MTSLDSFKCCRTLKVGAKTYAYYSLPVAEKNGLKGISRLPFSMKVLLENLLRNEDGRTVTKEDIQAFAQWLKTKTSDREIAFRPARVLMQDFTGVPAVVDLAAMRDAMKHARRRSAKKINPLVPVDLVIDHSVAVNFFGHKRRVQEERRRGIQAEPGALQIPEMGAALVRAISASCRPAPASATRSISNICRRRCGPRRTRSRSTARSKTHARSPIPTRWSAPTRTPPWSTASRCWAGASAASRRKPPCSASRYSMVLPEVIGFKLTGKLKEGVTATDLVLTVTQMLRKRGVVGKFVEFFGPGLADLTIADRATIGNMAPEYGATCGFFPVDDDTMQYLTRHRPHRRARGAGRAPTPRRRACYRTKTTPDPMFTDVLKLDLGAVEPSLAGPKRPQDRVALKEVKAGFADRDGQGIRQGRRKRQARPGRRAATTISATATW